MRLSYILGLRAKKISIEKKKVTYQRVACSHPIAQTPHQSFAEGFSFCVPEWRDHVWKTRL